MTRFRRHLAAIPFVIIFLLPVAVAGLYVARTGGAEENLITPVELNSGIKAVCVEADTLALAAGACPADTQGAE